MNKSQFGWCDFSWNPVTGCKRRCNFCYGSNLASRLCGTVRINLGNPQIQSNLKNRLFVLEKPFHNEEDHVLLFPAGFEPTLHRYRLRMVADKKKPANIYVCSMGELFGDWVPLEWIKTVFEACQAAPWHNYLFLTKNPSRYAELNHLGLLPRQDNFWYGTRIDGDTEAFISDQYHTFLCIEPLNDFIDGFRLPQTEWIILGCNKLLPSRRNLPKRDWIDAILRQCGDIPVYMKRNNAIRAVWKGRLIQQYPELLKRPKEKPIPHCNDCPDCKIISEGKRGYRHICRHRRIFSKYKETGGMHIPGRYARTSPPWCPKR